MIRLNPFRALVTAAGLYGVDGLRAQGYVVDAAEFNEALRAVWALGEVALSSVEPPRKSEDDGSMDTTDVAARLGVTEAAVRLAARQGRLNGHQADGRWWFHPSDVEAWEARR